MTALPRPDPTTALMAAAREALHVAPEQVLDDSYLRAIANTVLAYHVDTRREEWTPAMIRLHQELVGLAYVTRDEALMRMAVGIGVTHALPSQHDHLGRTFPCGLHEARENYSSRHAAVTVSTRPGDRVTCPRCLTATGAR